MILSDQTAYNPATYYDNHHLHMNCLNSRNIASANQRCETQHDLVALTARSESAPEGASRPYCRFHCHCLFIKHPASLKNANQLFLSDSTL